jgi:hypothetical protein
MMYVWKRRPVSDRGRSGAARHSGLVFLGILLTLLPAGSVLAEAGDHVITFVTDWHPAGQEQEWLEQDRRWFRSLPAVRKFPVPAFPDSASPSGLAMDPAETRRVKSLVGAAAAAIGDSMPVVRPVAALLRDRWMDRGYLSASVAVRGDSLRVCPGHVWTVGVIDIAGDDFPGRSHLLATWLPRVGDRFKREEWNQGIDMVLVGTGEAGYPFPRWVTREVALVPESHTVIIRAMLLRGSLAYIGPVTSDLGEERAARFLARTTGLRPGQVFRHSDLARARQRLLARDLYTTVGEPQVYLTSAGDTVGIHWPVVPRRKVNRLQVVLGLSRPDDGSGSRVSGEVDLRLPNMAGTGRNLQVGWRDDGNQKSRFGFSYLEPLAFGTPLDMGLAMDNEVEQDSYTRFRLENVWRLPVVALWGVELGVGWDRATYPIGSLERTSRVRARGAVLNHRGDRTVSGWEGLFAIETARRSASLRPADESDTPTTAQLAESVTQRIFEVDSAGELWLGRTFSLAGRASFRQLTGGEPNVPLSEQFRFGGAASLRGYREEEFHGSVAAWGSVEARIGRPGGSRLYTFYDLGYFEFWSLDPLSDDPADLLRISGQPRGYGLGILARTMAGDISLAIGFPGTVDFDQAKLHVTLLESF